MAEKLFGGNTGRRRLNIQKREGRLVFLADAAMLTGSIPTDVSIVLMKVGIKSCDTGHPKLLLSAFSHKIFCD